MRQVVIDTNFLLIPGQFGVDIFEELKKACDFPFKFGVMQSNVNELEHIVLDKTASARDRKAALLGLQLLKNEKIPIVDKGASSSGVDKGASSSLIGDRKVFKSADKAILDLASSLGGNLVVATQDKELRLMLKEKGVIVAVLRQKKYVVLD